MQHHIDRQIASQDDEIPEQSSLAQWVIAALGPQTDSMEVTIRIVDEAESAKLNQAYRHKDGPTNVLSFPFEAQIQAGPQLLGDLVICAPVIRREALEQHKPLPAHWAHMVVHGILHLLGYDHELPQEAERMESKEIEILQQLGFANPYTEQTSP